jgi:hypothetical protein
MYKSSWWVPVFFLLAKFRTLARKKNCGESNKGLFQNLKKLKSPYLERKKLELAIFRQCVPLGSQN